MEKPDWVLWNDSRKCVTLEECVCLSLDSEPHQKPAPIPAAVPYEAPARNPNDEPQAAPVVIYSGDHRTKQQRNESLALTHEALRTTEGQERLIKLRRHFDEGSGLLPPAGQRSYYGYEEKRVNLLDFARWAHVMKWSVPEPLDLTPKPAPDIAEPVPVVVDVVALLEPAKAGPVPVTTRAMADSFAGLHWSGEQWIKKLGDKPVWLDGCIVLNRSRGEGMRQWNPVLIGAYLLRMGHVQPKSVRAKFQTQDALKPWLEDWRNYETDNYPTD